MEVVRTLDMVRTHVKGFGGLLISQSVKRGRVVTAQLVIGTNHRRYVTPELDEVVQPAVDVLTLALRDWHLSIDTDTQPMTVSIRA